MIPVTKPFLPPKEEYENLLKGIWKRNWLTNHGPLVSEFELNMKEYLDVPHMLFLTNGTIALQIAIKALGLKGEIITTPFSYVATTSSIVWEGCKPIFVDINKNTFNINPNLIEEAISKNTTAILATHVFGNPCEIEEIDRIAKKHKLKVIYDASHCFGVKYNGNSIFEYGDISTTSFHATKLFHTIEGGAVFTQSPDLLKKMAFMANFGHNTQVDFAEIGINGKNSEFHAAMGLVNLKFANEILTKRKHLFELYMKHCKGLKFVYQWINKKSTYNFSYFPVLFKNTKLLEKSLKLLVDAEIFPRRYFCPSLNKLSYVQSNKLEVSEDISSRILCLPLFHDLTEEEIMLICRLLKRTQNN